MAARGNGWWGGTTWAAGALAAAVVALAPATASAWPCSVEVEKTVAIDEDCDGGADGAFADAVTQETDRCVVYRICVANTGEQDLRDVLVSDSLFGGASLLWELLPWSSPGPTVSCVWLPAHPFDFMPPCAVDPETDEDYCRCGWVEGTSTATITAATCVETGRNACGPQPVPSPTPVCEDAATVACVEDADGCLTRSAGFWANHAEVVRALLQENGPVSSCGNPLAPGSVELCPPGRAKGLARQEAQLRRQCAAAALSRAATLQSGGSCGEALSAERFLACCGSAEACASVPPGCYEELSAFNESADSLLDGLGQEISLCHELGISCSAEPLQCPAADGRSLRARR